MSLFSSFDNFFHFSTISPFVLLFMTLIYYSYKNSLLYFFVSIISQFFLGFFNSLSPKLFKFWPLVLVSLFISFFLFNFISVCPFNFPNTSMISGVLFISLMFWSSIFLLWVINSFKSFFYHSVPDGTPMSLVWFIFLIELVSQMIRPITLVVRLCANVLAGHLLMILLSTLVLSNHFFFLGYLFLNMVEFLVSLIQSYIFVTMVYLYSSEAC